jgi:hypothetical protein
LPFGPVKEVRYSVRACTAMPIRSVCGPKLRNGFVKPRHLAGVVDGTLRRWVPIWVVSTGGQVYVRTWYRRETGWFGQVLASHRARIRVPGLEADAAVKDVGESTPELRAGIDAAYSAKYGRHGGTERMVTDEAAAATLRISPDG